MTAMVSIKLKVSEKSLSVLKTKVFYRFMVKENCLGQSLRALCLLQLTF